MVGKRYRKRSGASRAPAAPVPINFGSPEWLKSVADVAQAIGQSSFEQRLFELLNRVLHIDHCVVFTFTPLEGPGHLFTRSKMPDDEAQELARDYVAKYYRRDPHFAEASAAGGEPETRPFHPRLAEEYDADYRDHFFLQHDLVDKISTIGRVDEGNVYCNFWRMGDSGPYSKREEKLLASVLPLLTSLISAHFRLVKSTADTLTADAPAAARSLIHSVISRRVEPFNRLTGREAEICERILVGYTSLGISLDLGIAISSVNTYRRRAYEKLGIAAQNELFSLCLEALNRIRR